MVGMGRSIYSIDAWMIGLCETPTARHPIVFGLRWGSQHSADNMEQTTCDAQRTTCNGQRATDNMRRAADSFPAARGGQAGGGARVAGRAEEEVLRLPLLRDGSAHFGAGRATRNAAWLVALRCVAQQWTASARPPTARFCFRAFAAAGNLACGRGSRSSSRRF